MAFGDFTVVRSTVKRVLNSSGVLEEVAVNTPAFEFNADGTYKGLLVEPGATNLLLYSQEFDNAAWTKSDSTISANAVVAPDGTTTADTLIVTATDFTVFRASSTTGVQTHSVFAKAGTGNVFYIYGSFGGTDFSGQFNLLLGTVVSVAAGTTAVIEELPNGWYRCSITYNTGLSGNIGYFTSGGGAGYSITLWGAQLEAGSVATSYIPTEATTVTRTADQVYLSSASSLIGQGTGTMYFEFSQIGQVSLTNLFDSGTSNGIQIYRSGTNEVGIYVRTGDVDRIVTTTGDAFVVGSPNKVAIAYAVNDITIYLNGVKIYENLATPPEIPTLSVVSLSGYSGTVASQVSEFRAHALFPSRLSNSQLATLTTL